MVGGVAVPLAISHPLPELEYVISDCGTKTLLYHPEFAKKLRPLIGQQKLNATSIDKLFDNISNPLPEVDPNHPAMILYTSGTTSRPKGVVLTHGNLNAQIANLITAWEWNENDHILHVLPLHHTHGIVNALLCALWAGAVCEMLPRFNPSETWHRFVHSDLTLFMAVPTIYRKLIEVWQGEPDKQEARSKACAKMRVMVSGSAALPTDVFETWQQISGHRLLERYGMTEIGMALSNPLHGERRPGFVGIPLPNVEVKLMDDAEQPIVGEDSPGEIYVKGRGVFKEYWQRPEATQQAFAGGWFRTGDIAKKENGYYRILGRRSVDIIKTGGHKVSALEIEAVLRTYPTIEDCAVVGVPDTAWGERVCAAVIAKDEASAQADDISAWMRERIAHYKLPRTILFVDSLPRNALGKVTKSEVKKLFD